MHPAEASHGDLGMLTSKDVVLALSNSGTAEIVLLLPLMQRLGTPLISLTSDANSTLARASDAHLLVSVPRSGLHSIWHPPRVQQLRW